MTDKTIEQPDDSEAPKRRQIMEGARAVFQANGFDGASMEQIAKSAGVSKGTLYVYFANKEELFKALILAERVIQADASLAEESYPEPVEELLQKIGQKYLKMFLRPEKLSTLRMVLGATDKFPAFGALLFEAGPVSGRMRLARIIEAKCAAGELKCDDAFLAANQFADLCGSFLTQRSMFLIDQKITKAEVDKNVTSAVRVFLAAYGAKA
ncbi:TetR/AcrR family transcriptional regulator [Roseibium limicola]|uniref:TetR/AcrR family transcriptional regulator n=1 Tax=Roseibium limicola TaxID=2816037 RepID=A0A939J5U9_9HYPH|nr:TetR/AcrR family transcriptional regulator [Roseibium limicola]MBO0344452.1 TetR/AcrR family transcriptional regulator [Roseibium limicola]